ncbi:hypothetical protein [Roseovarius atlanticus]|uniref:hypothetical protein n=1 Tax=Roseovarius atlanticus TaxID=1641875 RepID=UPI001C9832BE|nr:hypothetical protein [Roseovarius atlanticus]MBY5987329.1 hypothetical protein [Roseovarius atlanticus]MBY6125969.1 hypothetical protein [Roseovarius atlanticus]MBY6149571.1 hypothetical protein [Roseovarius atlanticus]
MDPDLIFVIGLVLGVFSIPAILAAISDGHAPRVAALTVIAAGVMVFWAISNKPGGYDIYEIPNVFVQVVARYLT